MRWLAFALLLGLVACHALAPHVSIQDHEFEGVLGDRLSGRLFLPTDGRGPWPVVVCLHSFWQAPQNAWPQAEAFAASGYAAFCPPLVPYSEVQHRNKAMADFVGDVQAACALLRRQPDVDGHSIFLFGHSMGADLACTVGRQDPGIAGVVAAGFPVDADPGAPRHLLLSVGAWDELHPLSEMQAAVQRSGDGTLFVQPMVDHGLEIFDPDLVARAVQWMDACRGTASVPAAQTLGGWLMAQALTAAAALGLAVGLLASVSLCGSRFWAARGPVLVAVAVTLAGGLAWRSQAWSGLHDLVLLAVVSAMLAPVARPGTARQVAVHAGVAWFALLCTVLVNAPAALAASSARAWLVLVYLPVVDFGMLVSRLESLAFHGEPQTTGLTPVLPVLLAVELLWPGGAAALAVAGLGRLRTAVQGLDLRMRPGASRGQMLGLCLAGLGALLAWHQTLAAGYGLDAPEILRLVGRMVRYFLVPVLVAAFALRTPLYRRAVNDG